MKQFIRFIAIGVMTVVLAACASDSERVVVRTGVTVYGNINYSCLFEASVAADRSLLHGDSMFVVIRDQSEWDQLWEYVLDGRPGPGSFCLADGQPPQVSVDFDDKMVILIVEVQPSSGYAIRIDQVLATGGGWTVEATRTTPCCGVSPAFTYPHHIIATERFDGEVALVVTELVRGTPPGAP